jgi:5-methylcytosine-specific restriction endonuclease McrA
VADRSGLYGRARRNALEAVRELGQPCWLCGYPVDLTLDMQRHPLGSSVDEVIPRSHGGDSTDLANLRHAHRICNTSRGNRPPSGAVRDRCRVLVSELLGIKPEPVATRKW